MMVQAEADLIVIAFHAHNSVKSAHSGLSSYQHTMISSSTT